MANYKYESLAERIIANSVVADGPPVNGELCWIWLGSRKVNRSGMWYARMTVRIDGKPRGVKVSRVVLRVFKRLILRRDRVAAHRCNQPLCVNPAHIELVSHSNNMQQCSDDGRIRNQHMREPGED